MTPFPSPVPSAALETAEPVLATERRDNRILAGVMSAAVLVSLLLMYAR